MEMFIFGLILGTLGTIKVLAIINKGHFKILGIDIRIIKDEPDEAKEEAKAVEKVKLKQITPVCDLCHGEPVKLGKQKIPCPKCKAA